MIVEMKKIQTTAAGGSSLDLRGALLSTLLDLQDRRCKFDVDLFSESEPRRWDRRECCVDVRLRAGE
jgi:hypothetical protein